MGPHHATTSGIAPITAPRVGPDQRAELTLLVAGLRKHDRCGSCRDARLIRARIDTILDDAGH